jgi:release factor glutamine methyltransferase
VAQLFKGQNILRRIEALMVVMLQIIPDTRQFIMVLLLCPFLGGCGTESPRSETGAANHLAPVVAQTPGREKTPGIVRWEPVDGLPRDVAIMESVFWEPADTDSLRQKIFNDPRLPGATVLEIGTGSGLISLCCLQAGAEKVVATDLNLKAIENVRFNAAEMGFTERLDARQVPRRAPEAWTVIKPDETFDFIISNPPWENRKPVSVEEFALYDPDFQLLKSLVTGARTRLRPAGRMWLAYGCVTAIRRIQEVAAEQRLSCTLLDDRSLDSLPEVFLPGMLIELRVPDAR